MKILDSSALINAYSFRHGYTIREVIDEIKDPGTRSAVSNLIFSRKLFIMSEKPSYLEKVKEATKKTGDSLSGVDKKLLALALETKGIIVTDDYGIQNVAKKLGLGSLPVQQAGIRRRYLWKHYCPACRKYRPHMVCETCGTRTRKRVVSSYR